MTHRILDVVLAVAALPLLALLPLVPGEDDGRGGEARWAERHHIRTSLGEYGRDYDVYNPMWWKRIERLRGRRA